MYRIRVMTSYSMLTGTVLFLVLVLFNSSPLMADDSSCITCHTDEEMLLENLGKEEKKKSGLQAGSG